jgi:DNA invertase Pin-like site-specific DNA recombinase
MLFSLVAKRQMTSDSGARVAAYIRVSTTEQVDSGAGLSAQRTAIATEIERRGWRLVELFEDAGASGKSLAGREGLSGALEAVANGSADILLVSKLDRLSRSLVDFATLMERSQRERWALVALDLGVDSSTPAGEFMASVMASAAQWERRIIGQRTRDALAAKKAAGVRLGRSSHIDRDVLAHIVNMRESGVTLQRIADALNGAAVPTTRGGSLWRVSSIRAALTVDALDREAAEAGRVTA